MMIVWIYYSASVAVRSILVSLSVCVCLSVREHISGTALPILTKFCLRIPVARSSSGGIALRYVLPVLWMTSCLAVVGVTLKRWGCTMQRRPWAAWRYQTEPDVCECLFDLLLVVLQLWTKWGQKVKDQTCYQITYGGKRQKHTIIGSWSSSYWLRVIHRRATEVAKASMSWCKTFYCNL